MKVGLFKKLHFTWKKAIVLILILVVAGGLLYSCSRMREQRRNSAGAATVTTLKKASLRNSVSVSGIIQSKTSENVYTTLNYPVKQVMVKEGDTVKEGDVLAILDTSSLEKDIESTKYTITSTQQSASLSYQKAKADYENALYLYNNNLNLELINAKSTFTSAEQALNNAKSGNGGKAALDAAQAAYDKASASLTYTQNKVAQDIKNLKTNYDSAKLKYDDRSQQINLEKLQQNLSKATIKSPVSGTVTVANAVVGAPVNGILFTVEDAGNLIIKTEIKEYDVGQVTPGKKVVIKSDATGDEEIEGEVSSVAPAATQNTQGTNSVTFAAEIKIKQQNPKLKIGMKARLNIVLDEKSDVYSVPYDAVLHKDDGSAYVFVAVKDGEKYKAKEQPVKTGLETDISIEISGDGITDGVKVVSNPDNITNGSFLKLQEGAE